MDQLFYNYIIINMQKRGNENSFLIILGLALMIITTNSTQLTIPLTPQKTFCFN